MNLVIDLDGTLIDSRTRLYRLFGDLLPDSHLSFDEYWDLKRRKVSNETILRELFEYSDDEVAVFVGAWMSLIEAPQYLALDSNFPGIHETLVRLRQAADLFVCTARQNRDAALVQLESLGLLGFFDHVLVTQHRDSKESLIERFVSNRTAVDWMIGDTGKDVQVGKLLGLQTCAVLSGFLGRDSLASYEPDLIIDRLTDFASA